MPGIFDRGIFDRGIFDVSTGVDVPALVITLTPPPPVVPVAVPALVLTLTEPAPSVLLGLHADVPALVLALTGPAPSTVAGTRVDVPALLVSLRLGATLATGGSGAGGLGPFTTGPLRIFKSGLEITARAIQWDATFEEVLGGTGAGKITFTDRDPENSGFDVNPYEDIQITIRTSGWILFWGEVGEASFEVVPGATFLVWTASLRDYNDQFGQRLVGPPTSFWRATPDDEYQAIDGLGITRGSLEAMLHDFFIERIQTANGPWYSTHVDTTQTFDTTLYAYQSMTTIAGMLQLQVSMASVNIQGWMWPTGEFVMGEIPQAVPLAQGAISAPSWLPTAPVALNGDGSGGKTEMMSLTISKTGPQPQEFYVQGGTTYTLDKDTGLQAEGGSGWYSSAGFLSYGSRSKRQVYVAAPQSATQETKNVAGAIAATRAAYPTIRGSLTVQGVDGWRTGQVVSIENAKLPASLHNGSGVGLFVIQRVSGHLYPGRDVREYTLDFGDGPVATIASYSPTDPYADDPRGKPGVAAKPPTFDLEVTWDDDRPVQHGQVRTFRVFPSDTLNAYYKLIGNTIHFALDTWQGGAVTDAGYGGLIDPADTEAALAASSADAGIDGSARGSFTANSTHDDYEYEVRAWIVITST